MSAKNLQDFDDRGNPRESVNTTCIVQDDQILIVRYRISGDAILVDSVKTPDGLLYIYCSIPAIISTIRRERNLYR